MKYSFLFFAVFSCITISLSDEIKFNNGQWLKNVLVADTVDNVITVITPTDTRAYDLSTVDEIIKSKYNHQGMIVLSDIPSTERVIVTHSHKELALFGGLIAVVGWEFLNEASNVGKDNDLKIRKKLFGYGLIVGGLISMYVCTLPVEIDVTPSSIGVSYNLP